MATSTKPSTTSRICVERLKAPSLARWVERLAERARSDGWTHEEFLAACLEREVAARQDHSGEGTHPRRTVPRPQDARERRLHLPTLPQARRDHAPRHTRLRRRARERRVLGAARHLQDPPRDRDLDPGACQAGHRVAFATAAEWVARLGDARSQGRLHGELRRLGRIPLLVIDEVR
jgi:IstB-like ATP binding protein